MIAVKERVQSAVCVVHRDMKLAQMYPHVATMICVPKNSGYCTSHALVLVVYLFLKYGSNAMPQVLPSAGKYQRQILDQKLWARTASVWKCEGQQTNLCTTIITPYNMVIALSVSPFRHVPTLVFSLAVVLLRTLGAVVMRGYGHSVGAVQLP